MVYTALPVRARRAAEPQDRRAREASGRGPSCRRRRRRSRSATTGSRPSSSRRTRARSSTTAPTALYRSFDRGDTWTAHLGRPHLERRAGRRAVRDHHLADRVAQAFRRALRRHGRGQGLGHARRRRSPGPTCRPASPAARWVTRVVASAFDEGTVYVTQNGYRDDEFAPYVFRSIDYGKTWESICARSPGRAGQRHPRGPQGRSTSCTSEPTWASFVSLDRGATWTAMTGGLPHVPVHDLAVQPREGDLVLGTHGRSVFVAEAAPLRKLTAGRHGEAAARLRRSSPRQGTGTAATASTRTITVVPRGPRSCAWPTGPRRPARSRSTVKDENGSVWKELAGTAGRG